MILIKPLLLCLLMLLAPLQSSQAEAQEPESDPIRFGIWTGYSPVSVPLIGTMRNASLALAGLELQHSSFRIGKQRIDLSGEMILMARATYPINGTSGPTDQRLAMGLIPLRFSVPVWASPGGNLLQVESGAGILLFDKSYPNSLGTSLNAVVDIGASYTFRLTHRTALGIGYRLHHISNGGSGQINPGIDSNLFTLSLSSSI